MRGRLAYLQLVVFQITVCLEERRLGILALFQEYRLNLGA